MCQIVVTQDGTEIETPRQLQEVLGIPADTLLMYPGYMDIGAREGSYDSCLCPFDLDEALASAGYEYEHADPDQEYRITGRKPSP